MILNLTDQSAETLQDQLVRQVTAQILAGDLAAGSELPSIRGLAREQRVSVITVQRGYETLERSGLIRARRGKGFFVIGLNDDERQAKAIENLQANLEPVLQQASAGGLSDNTIIRTVENLLRGVIA